MTGRADHVPRPVPAKCRHLDILRPSPRLVPTATFVVEDWRDVMSDHPSSTTTRVRVVRGRDHAALVTALVADLGLHAVVTRARKRPRAKLAELPVAVLVGAGVAAPADPDLVGVVLAALAEIGCRDVRLLAAIPARDRDAGWTAPALAERHGYRDLRDPHDDPAPIDVPEWSVHHGKALPRDWTSAAVRLVIASSATDLRHGCALSVATIATLVPLVPGCTEGEAAADLLQILTPDLVILDASVTSHGVAGSARRRPHVTDTFAGSTSALLVDVVGAALLGLDAAESPLLISNRSVEMRSSSCARVSVRRALPRPGSFRCSTTVAARASRQHPPFPIPTTERANRLCARGYRAGVPHFGYGDESGRERLGNDARARPRARR